MHNLLQMQKLFADPVPAYLMLVNLGGFILMGWDKFMAEMGKTRIPEKALFLTALVGGSIGAWLGMQTFRHKTRHAQFVFGIPLIFMLQIGALLFIFYGI